MVVKNGSPGESHAYSIHRVLPNNTILGWVYKVQYHKVQCAHINKRALAVCVRSEFLETSNWPLEPTRPRWGLDLAARAFAASTRRSRWPLEPASEPQGRSNLLLKLGRSNLPLESVRFRRGARTGRSSPLGFAGALDRTEPTEDEPNRPGQAYLETLQRAGSRKPVALNT